MHTDKNLNMNPHSSLRQLFRVWSAENPSLMHNSQLLAIEGACNLFGEISDWPYDEVPSEMLDVFIDSRRSTASRRNMRFLVSIMDQSILNHTDQNFKHPEISDTHLVWLILNLRYAIQVESIRTRILSMDPYHQPFEVFAAKHLATLFGSVVEGTINLHRQSVQMCKDLFGTSASVIDESIIKEHVSSAPSWISSSMRNALAGIATLASGITDDRTTALKFPEAISVSDDCIHPDDHAHTAHSTEDAYNPKEETPAHDIESHAGQSQLYNLWDATLSDIHQIWLQQCAPLLSDNSNHKLNTGWNVLKPLRDRIFRSIRMSEIQELLLRVPATTQRSAKEIYAKLEKLAYSLDIIDKCRANTLQIDEIILQPRIPLAEGDIANLWIHHGEWYVDITLVLYYTGFRAGELAKLKKTDVNLRRLEITGGSKTQFGVNRIIPIHFKIEPIIRKWLSEEPGQYLIPQESGERFSNRNIEHAVKMATAAYCSRPHIPHECRHTFYTTLQRNMGIPDACVARLAGHNPKPLPVDVRVYSRPTPEQLRAAINTL